VDQVARLSTPAAARAVAITVNFKAGLCVRALVPPDAASWPTIRITRPQMRSAHAADQRCG
jgi:hypothetical protein